MLNPDAEPYGYLQRRGRRSHELHIPPLISRSFYYDAPPPPPEGALLPPPPPPLPHFRLFNGGSYLQKPASYYGLHPFHHQKHQYSSVFSPSPPSVPPPLLPLPASCPTNNNNNNNNIGGSWKNIHINGGFRRWSTKRSSSASASASELIIAGKGSAINNKYSSSSSSWINSASRIRSSTTSTGTGVYWRRKTTSLMIRNIPNRLSRQMLIEILDQHCTQVNKAQTKKVEFLADQEDLSESSPSQHQPQPQPLSQYDFLYLPMDFKKKLNLGYAFVNFTTAEAATRFHESFDNYKWEVFQTSKICKICPARIQGKDGLVGRFKHTYFACDSDEFLPVAFSPPRNGSTSCCTPPSIVGRRNSSTSTTPY